MGVSAFIEKNGGNNNEPNKLPISFYGFDAQPISNRVEIF